MPPFVSYGILLLTPLFFSSNLLFGKTVVSHVEPWTLAFIRWSLVSLILLPLVLKPLRLHLASILDHLALFGIMGFFGMWICGAVVYYGLTLTSATNATLIYLCSPVLILLIEAVVRGRVIKLREGLGILGATIGVMVILTQGSWTRLMAIEFNPGDLAILAAAVAWAVFSVVNKSKDLASLPNLLTLFLFSAAGAALLLPFFVVEVSLIGLPSLTLDIVGALTGIVLCSSLIAFLGFQHSIRFAGPAMAGIFMYLLPIYGVSLAVLLLGEAFEWFHLVGIITILGGVIMATLPAELMRARLVRLRVQ